MKHEIYQWVRAIAVVCLAAAPAWADNDGDPGTESIARVVPYDGFLNLDGTALSGTVDVVFTLYDAADGGEAVWTETWSTAEGRPVTVTAGRFTVALGTYEGIEDVIADAGTVYLGIQVKLPEGADYVALGGRQRLNPVPYAMWTAHATDLDVGGILSVRGDATVGGTVAAERFSLQVDAGGTATGLRLQDEFLDVGPGSALFASGVRVPNNLTVVGATALYGNVTLGSQLNVGSATTLQGNVQANNNLRVNGTSTLVGDVSNSGTLTAGRLVSNGGAEVAEAARVRENFYVHQDVYLYDCRVCINVRQNIENNRVSRHACTRMEAGQNSGWVTLGDDINDNNQFGISFVCDNGNNTTGNSNVGM